MKHLLQNPPKTWNEFCRLVTAVLKEAQYSFTPNHQVSSRPWWEEWEECLKGETLDCELQDSWDSLGSELVRGACVAAAPLAEKEIARAIQVRDACDD